MGDKIEDGTGHKRDRRHDSKYEDDGVVQQPWDPPDGGYGWIIVSACFFLTVMSCSYAQLGVLLLKFASHFKVPLTVFGWLNAVQTVPGRLLGVFTGPIIERFGCRKMTFVGVLLISGGFLSSAFVSNISLLYFTFGFIPGVGSGCLTCCALIAPQQYFDKKRSLAYGIVLVGLNCAFFIWPPIATILMNKLGYKYTLIVEAAMMLLVGSVCGVLLKPRKMQTVASKKKEKEELHTDTALKSRVKDIRECCNKHVYSIVDVRPLKNAKVSVFLTATLFGTIGHQTSVVYTPTRSKLSGMADDVAALHGATMGITAGVMSFVFAAIGNISGCNRSLMYCLGHLFSGILTLVSVVLGTSPEYFGYAVFTGIFQGLFLGVEQPLMGDLCGPKLHAVTVGWFTVQLGLAHLIAHPLTGWLLEMTGNHNSPFYLAGVSQTLGALALAYIPWTTYRNSQSVDLHNTRSKNALDHTFTNETFRECT